VVIQLPLTRGRLQCRELPVEGLLPSCTRRTGTAGNDECRMWNDEWMRRGETGSEGDLEMRSPGHKLWVEGLLESAQVDRSPVPSGRHLFALCSQCGALPSRGCAAMRRGRFTISPPPVWRRQGGASQRSRGRHRLSPARGRMPILFSEESWHERASRSIVRPVSLPQS
jgi:hypothetical protein